MSRSPFWLALCLLAAGTATAQPQSPSRERQNRRAALSSTPTELRVSADTITTVMLNGSLDRDSLVLDRTRFRWAEVSEHMLHLQLVADLGASERLVVRVNFKDRAVPAQALFVVTTHPTEVDGVVEVDRRANTPEALAAALAERDAQVEALKARCEVPGPMGVARSGLLDSIEPRVRLRVEPLGKNQDISLVPSGVGDAGETWAVATFELRNPPGAQAWTPGPPVLIGADGRPIPVRSVWLEKPRLEPGEEGRLIVETQAPPWAAGQAFQLELTDQERTRRLSFRVTASNNPGGPHP